ncbi:C6 zinc finger protein [Rutstroemia sp. NJR-2017a WRK4]|nr:C6 zinc finger protein [Rutstroemia sp. NJR-2017a WRK4]
MTTSVKRACDACHRRKVKCDGINPCRNCSSAQLCCTYHAIPQKKGPKGSRAKVISELRETQRQTTLSSKVANRLNGVQSPPCSPTLTPTPGLLTTDMIKECTEFFFANMYPTMPILHRGKLEQQSMYADQNVDVYCLLTAMCAFMMIQPGMGIPGDPLGLDSMPGANIVSGQLLLDETLRVRKSYDYLETPTQNSLVTSFFLFGCYYGLDSHNKAWFHLREATTLAHILNMQKEETYHQLDVIESSRRRRLYWLLFVTERSYALQRHRPLSLQATINLPSQNDDPSDTQAHHLHGFIHLVNVYRPFDDQFVALWNKTRTDCNPAYLSSLQKQLTDALPLYINSTENQTADLRTSQQWLRTMVWQLSIQNGCLSSNANDPSMTFQYPVDVARDLVQMTSQFSQQSMEVHGVGLIEKLFDVACSLTDVLSLLPPKSDPFAPGPRDYLHQFMTLFSILRNGDHRFLPLLLNKVHDVLPSLANPMLQTVPEHPPICAEVDIFDGFGNTGLSVPPSYNNNIATSGPTDFKMENQSLAPFDKRVEGLSSPSAIDSAETTPYTSPPIMGSGMEFSGFSDYGGFSDLNHGLDFKREFEPNHGMVGTVRRPPIRQGSGSSYGIPRSVPEYHHFARTGSGGEEMGHGLGDMGFR